MNEQKITKKRKLSCIHLNVNYCALSNLGNAERNLFKKKIISLISVAV